MFKSLIFILVMFFVILTILHFTNVFDLTTLFTKKEVESELKKTTSESAEQVNDRDTKLVIDEQEPEKTVNKPTVEITPVLTPIKPKGVEGDPCEINDDCSSALECNKYLKTCKRPSFHKPSAGFTPIEGTENEVTEVTDQDVFLIRSKRGNCLGKTDEGNLTVQPNLAGNKPDAAEEDVLRDRCDASDPNFLWTTIEDATHPNYKKYKVVNTNKCLALNRSGLRWSMNLNDCTDNTNDTLWSAEKTFIRLTAEKQAQYGSKDNYPFFNMKSKKSDEISKDICLEIDPWKEPIGAVPRLKHNYCERGYRGTFHWQFPKKL